MLQTSFSLLGKLTRITVKAQITFPLLLFSEWKKKENGVTCCPASPVSTPQLDPQHMESEPGRPKRLQPLGEVSVVLRARGIFRSSR